VRKSIPGNVSHARLRAQHAIAYGADQLTLDRRVSFCSTLVNSSATNVNGFIQSMRCFSDQVISSL
jgi:hypothetical protein